MDNEEGAVARWKRRQSELVNCVERGEGEREVGEGMSDGEGGGRRKKVMMADHRRFCSACE